MELCFRIPRLAAFMAQVTGIAPGIQRGMPTPFIRYMLTLVMTIKTEVGLLVAGFRLLQEAAVFRLVWVVTLKTIGNHGRMNRVVTWGDLLLAVTTGTERLNSNILQYDSGIVTGSTNKMATQASHLNGGVNDLTLRFIRVAL